jgi:hypothetical protein
MNTYIVDSCTKENTADRTIYRCTWKETFLHADKYVGYKVRIAQWLATGTNPDPNTFGKAQIMVITVPKGCYNAGKINDISASPQEGETLVPPYSVFKVDKVVKNEEWFGTTYPKVIYMTITQDNKSEKIWLPKQQNA